MHNDNRTVTARAFPLDVLVDGTQYGLFGVAHDGVTHSAYVKRLRETAVGRDNWLLEQGLGLFFNVTGGTEVSDFAANSSWRSFREALPIATYAVPLAILVAYRAINPEKTVQNDLSGPASQVEPTTKVSRVESSIRFSRPYDHVTRRSAYEAEFMRAWKAGHDKNLIVGAGHLSALNHFLMNPVEDNEIIDLASRHAELLETNPGKYHWVRRFHSGKEAAAMGVGAIVGAAPYFGLLSIW